MSCFTLLISNFAELFKNVLMDYSENMRLRFIITTLLIFISCSIGFAASANYVDLGLSVKWATCNLGATKSSENGELYAWGETATKSNFTWSNYVYANGSSSTVMNIGNDIAGTQYDAATALWGEDWRMPTEEEFKELLEKCTFTVATVDGVKGGKFTGPSGNSIFLPYAGCIYDGSVVGKGSRALYWTSTLTSTSQKASAFYITSGKPFMSTGYRRSGFSIRPVCNIKSSETPETPKVSYVDLGLSVKWATCNLGATKSSENGELYAWGETATKSNFTWSNYVYANGSSSTVMNIGNDIAGTQYDAATALWGEDWRMPTEEEFKELLEKCTFTVATVDGVKGGKFTGPSGNSIFLPYAGCIYDGSVVGKGSRALYWTSTLTSTSQKASAFYITSGKPFMSTGYRRSGFSIRPVCDTKAPEAPENSEDPIINPNPEDSLWDSDAVDLGLSVKWASCNFRAEEETDLGELFAWGETDTKSDFTWSNYIYAEGSASSVMNIGSEISNTQYDPVFVSNSQNGDDQWRMPTGKEIQELKSKCTFKETSKGNVKGMTVTGPNGNSIFLPYGGCKYDGKVLGGGTAGYYWSGTLYSSNYGAYTLTIKNSVPSYSYCYRRTGVYIRPVCGEGSGESGIIDNLDPGYSGPGPSPILPDPYFSNHSLFDTDGIESVGESSTIDTDIYTLSGIKVDARNLKSGVYVRKGRKFVIK